MELQCLRVQYICGVQRNREPLLDVLGKGGTLY